MSGASLLRGGDTHEQVVVDSMGHWGRYNVGADGTHRIGRMRVVSDQWIGGGWSAVQPIDGPVGLWASGDCGNRAVKHFWATVSHQDALGLYDLLRHSRNRD